jgi:hypothetical protein
MTQTSTGNGKVIDLTGLPEKAIEAVRAIVEALRQQTGPHQPSTLPQEWKRRFDSYMQEVAARADRYPEGFVLDDSRETIYEGRGE